MYGVIEIIYLRYMSFLDNLSRGTFSVGDDIDSIGGVMQIHATDSGIKSFLYDRHSIAVIQG